MEHRNKIKFPCVAMIHESGHKGWGMCKKKLQFGVKVKKLIKMEGDLDLICRLKIGEKEEQERKMRSKSKFNKFS